MYLLLLLFFERESFRERAAGEKVRHLFTGSFPKWL